MSANPKHISFKSIALGTLLLLLSLSIGCNEPTSDAKELTKNSEVEGYHTLTQGSVERSYILHVPPAYDSSSPVPLLINFHGLGGEAYSFSTSLGEGDASLNAVADRNNFMVVYPQGVERSKEGTEWDPGDNGAQQIGDNDPYFVEELVATISKDYNLDLSRVYAAGYSNGGMMAYGLACSRSDLIAAVGIMSGIMLEGDCAPDVSTSVIHFHGTADDVLPLNGNEYFQPVPDVINYWVAQNGISPSSLQSTQLNEGAITRDVYTSDLKNVSVALYMINSEYGKPGGHVWFTEDIEENSPNEILWEFLSAYSLDD